MRSSSDLTTAIRSPTGDDLSEVDAFLLARVNTILNIGFVPDWSPQERAGVIDEYRRALRIFPKWALIAAFDQASRTFQRRPTPGEICILADRQVKPFRDELVQRRKVEEARRAAETERAATRVTPETAAAILSAAGFTPARIAAVCSRRMPGALAEADDKRGHWSDGVASDGPEIAALRASRDANPLIQQSRRSAKP